MLAGRSSSSRPDGIRFTGMINRLRGEGRFQVLPTGAESQRPPLNPWTQEMTRFLTTFVCVFWLTGCASVLEGSQQVVSVRAMCGAQSMPAVCVAENSRGRWSFMAPRDILVSKDMYALRVTCRSVLVEPHTVQVPAVVQGAMAGNVLLGGLVGAAVDIGSARGLAYPAHVDVSYPSCHFF